MNRCANNNEKQPLCRAAPTPGHIYCDPCRIACGGYDRYNPPWPQGHNHKPGVTSANTIA
jgi:hypothetical protein